MIHILQYIYRAVSRLPDSDVCVTGGFVFFSFILEKMLLIVALEEKESKILQANFQHFFRQKSEELESTYTELSVKQRLTTLD